MSNTYKVKHGESYWSIAEKLGLDYKKLQTLNNNKALFEGTVLITKKPVKPKPVTPKPVIPVEPTPVVPEPVIPAPVTPVVPIKKASPYLKQPDVISALPFNKQFIDNVSCSYTCHLNRKVPSTNPGTDIAMPVGSAIYAAHNGVVTITDNTDNGAGGIWVRLQGSKGVVTEYLHLSKIAVKKGQRVAAGSLLGMSGNTGASTGPHCHFVVRIHGKNQDPKKYIAFVAH